MMKLREKYLTPLVAAESLKRAMSSSMNIVSSDLVSSTQPSHHSDGSYSPVNIEVIASDLVTSVHSYSPVNIEVISSDNINSEKEDLSVDDGSSGYENSWTMSLTSVDASDPAVDRAFESPDPVIDVLWVGNEYAYNIPSFPVISELKTHRS